MSGGHTRSARHAFLLPRFMRALKKNDVDETKRMLSVGIDVDTTFYRGYDQKPALCICIGERNTEVAEYLIEQGCSVNLPTGVGLTPLHVSILCGTYKLIPVLLHNRANVNARDNMLQTPLHLACVTGSYASYCALVDWGADVSAVDIDQRTPLTLACCNGNSDIAMSLIERGADVNSKDCLQNSPLTYAVSRKPCISLVKALVQHGAQINTNDNAEAPLLCFLRCLPQNYFWDITEACHILRFMISSGCNLNAVTRGGHNALHIATSYKYVEIVKILLNAGCESIADDLGKTPLFYACHHGYTKLVRLLIAGGIDWRQEVWLHNETLAAQCNRVLVSLCVQEARQIPTLCELSRAVVRRVLTPDIETFADRLCCPPLLKEYIKLEHY